MDKNKNMEKIIDVLKELDVKQSISKKLNSSPHVLIKPKTVFAEEDEIYSSVDPFKIEQDRLKNTPNITFNAENSYFISSYLLSPPTDFDNSAVSTFNRTNSDSLDVTTSKKNVKKNNSKLIANLTLSQPTITTNTVNSENIEQFYFKLDNVFSELYQPGDTYKTQEHIKSLDEKVKIGRSTPSSSSCNVDVIQRKMHF